MFVSAKTIHININLLVNFVYMRDDNKNYPTAGRIKRRIMSFADRYGPWTLILGASEGTGRALARKIAANGVPSILWGVEDEIAGYAPLSAGDRRKRVLMIEEMSSKVFGKQQ